MYRADEHPVEVKTAIEIIPPGIVKRTLPPRDDKITKINKKANDYLISSLKSSLKIGLGTVVVLEGVIGATVIFPLTFLGLGVGLAFGVLKSRKKGEIQPDKETILKGVVAGSLGFLGATYQGTRLIKQSVKEIKSNYLEYKHINDTKAERDYFEYKKKNEAIRAQIKSETTRLKNYRSDRQDLIAEKNKQIELLKTQLIDQKQSNPIKRAAFDKIYAVAISSKNETNDTENLEERIRSAVFAVKKGSAQKIDLGDRGFFILSKASLVHSSFIEIAMRTDQFAEGGFGIIYNLEYIHERKDREVISSKIMKIAKLDDESKTDILNEADNLFRFKNKKGLQGEPVVRFADGYIHHKFQCDGEELISQKIILRDYGDSSTNQLKHITRHLVSGVENLERKRIYHSDLKPKNMLYDGKNLIISDFGGARKITEILKENSLPEKPVDLFSPLTRSYVSEKIFLEVQSKFEDAKKKLADLDLDNHPENNEKGLKIIIEFNQKVEPLLYKNVKFALGLSLFAIWTGKDPPLDGFIPNSGGFTSLKAKDSEQMREVMNDMPKKTKKIIISLLAGGAS